MGALRLRPRDLAKIGQLLLQRRDGRFDLARLSRFGPWLSDAPLSRDLFSILPGAAAFRIPHRAGGGPVVGPAASETVRRTQRSRTSPNASAVDSALCPGGLCKRGAPQVLAVNALFSSRLSNLTIGHKIKK